MNVDISLDSFDNVSEKGKDYFEFHRGRYEYCVPKILKSIDGKRIIDLGSKYMFQASFISMKGIDVYAYDVEDTVNKDLIKKRAKKNGITTKSLGDLSLGEVALEEEDSKFDALVMSEVIEHLAFNPLKMWSSIFRVLKPESKIFISTPNSVSLENRIVEPARVLTGTGKGVSVDGIMDTPTYGHHWKEYSIKEIYRYFENLSIDKGNIKISTYSYRPYENFSSFQGATRNMLRKIGNMFEGFSDEILAIIKVPKNKPNIESPDPYV